jgi:hypothetical protein
MALVKKRRFYVIDVEDNRREVSPVNFTGKYTFERKISEGQFFYRKKYTNKIDFIKNTLDDYNYFNTIEHDPALRCQELILEIEVLCGTTWNIEWRGVFSTGQGAWDKNNCRFSVSVDPKDDYNCIIDNQSLEFNLLDSEDTIITEVTIVGDYEFYSCRSATPIAGTDYTDCIASRPGPPESWKEFFNNYDGVIPPPFDYIRVWIREVEIVSCVAGSPVEPTGDGWILQEDNCGVDDTATYVRQPLSDWTVINNPEVTWGECPEIEPPAPVFLEVDVVTTPTAGVRNDILGADFLNDVILPNTVSFFLDTPTNSVNTWAIENDVGTMVTATSNPTQYQFDVTYDSSGASIPATFDVVCREVPTCGGIIEHRKTITVRANSLTPTGDNVLYIEGVRMICPDQTEQTYTIPIEYREEVNLITWGVHPLLTIVSQTAFTITVTPTGASDGNVLGNEINLITAIANYNDGSQTLAQVQGFIRSATVSDAIQGQLEVCSFSEGVVYSVPARFGATYTWEVSGATIMSGQGTNEIVVDFADEGTVTIRVNEAYDCGCTWILISECDVETQAPPYWWCFKGSGIQYGGSYLLKDAFEFVLDGIGCSGLVGVTSDFFEWNPQGDAPNYVAGENYVTGLPNQLDYLTLTQKSDAKDPNATNPATIGKVKFKVMVKWLLEMFQVYWFIDGNRIRFEHISYFQEVLGLDLTLPEYALEMVKSNRYAYNSVERPKYETFSMDEAGNRDFIGDDIYYQTLCVNQDHDTNTLEHAVNGITTDIQFVNNSPDDVGNDGFVMLATNKVGDVYVTIIDDGKLSNAPIVNAPLSWANLHHYYFTYFRYWKDGYINNIYQVFDSYRNTVIQEPVNIKTCCDLLSFDASEAIKTPLGVQWFNGINGTIDKAEYDVVKETLKLTIGYPH